MDQLAFIALVTFATIVMVHYFGGGLTAAGAYLRWAFSGTVAGDTGRTSIALAPVSLATTPTAGTGAWSTGTTNTPVALAPGFNPAPATAAGHAHANPTLPTLSGLPTDWGSA